MYSTFERAVGSFWRRLPGNVHRRADGDVKLQEVGYIQGMARGVIDTAQLVRTHRNRLVHQQIEKHAEVMDIQDARESMLRYLNQLPATWM